MIELTEVESGMYDGFTPEEGRYVMQSAAAAPVRSADDMIGDWNRAQHRQADLHSRSPTPPPRPAPIIWR